MKRQNEVTTESKLGGNFHRAKEFDIKFQVVKTHKLAKEDSGKQAALSQAQTEENEMLKRRITALEMQLDIQKQEQQSLEDTIDTQQTIIEAMQKKLIFNGNLYADMEQQQRALYKQISAQQLVNEKLASCQPGWLKQVSSDLHRLHQNFDILQLKIAICDKQLKEVSKEEVFNFEDLQEQNAQNILLINKMAEKRNEIESFMTKKDEQIPVKTFLKETGEIRAEIKALDEWVGKLKFSTKM
ncbi:Hypothetical_protein [Hexamita inflata]|uniref:Hypothetical_protein n=1 Tax=Hexamita inflata TaxID=28002 RepID=A0ABP1HLT0_9EUKA